MEFRNLGKGASPDGKQGNGCEMLTAPLQADLANSSSNLYPEVSAPLTAPDLPKLAL